MEYEHEADNEYDDGAHVLDDDSRVGYEWPEIVGLESRISLKMFEEGLLICVIVGIYNKELSRLKRDCVEGLT